jgi:antagonist of KipI
MIQVLQPGMFTTVQDLGRYGYGPLGVSPSGAADPISLRIGNLLLGNPESAPALEMTLLGGKFVFPEGALIALTGSDFGASIPMYTATVIAPGGRLDVGPTKSGARCYLSVHGGIATKPLLGSASTHILSGLGGFEGRPLKKGDVLPVGPAHEVRPKTIVPEALAKLQPRKVLRATIAPQTAWFSENSVRLFYQSVWQVTEESNRMGLRLDGPELETPQHGHMISEGVSLGAIQIPAGGRPIILFVEQQTTGGYPKIANIISADLSSVGQLRPRDQIRFEHVTPDVARILAQEQVALLRSGVLFS